MFKKALVALDGSNEGLSVLSHLERILPTDARVVLCHVLAEPPLPTALPEGSALRPEQAMRKHLESVRAGLSRSAVDIDVRTGATPDRILESAREHGADLIAMATHGRSGLRRLVLGSVSESVLRQSTVPVWLTRPGLPGGDGPIRRIGVPLEHPGRTAGIPGMAKSLALRLPAELVLIHVVPAVPVVEPMTGAAAIPAPEKIPDPTPRLEGTVGELREEGIAASFRIAYGEPAATLVPAATEAGVDLIAMRTEGRDGLRRILQGSVAESVLREWKIGPIVISPPEAA